MTRKIIIETDSVEELSDVELNHIMNLFKNLKNFEIEIRKKKTSNTENPPIIIPYIPPINPLIDPCPHSPIWYRTTTSDSTKDIVYTFTL